MLPNEYLQLEYIESTGTQYINTEIRLENVYRIECEVASTVSGATNFFGFSRSNGSLSLSINGNKASVPMKNGSTSVPVSVNADKSYLNYLQPFCVDFKNFSIIAGTKKYTNMVELRTFFPTQISKLLDSYIFAINNNGSPNNFSYIRLGYFQIWNGEIIIRDFIPALRISDNKPGLYDLASNTFFVNQGTGEFIPGPISSIEENIFIEDNPCLFNIQDNVTLEASFRKVFDINIIYDETLGTAEYLYNKDNSVELVAFPFDNVQFKGWYLESDHSLISKDPIATFYPNNDTTIYAVFEPIYEIITLEEGNGSIEFFRSALDQNNIDISVIPALHWSFVKYLINGVEYTETPLNITITEPTTIVAVFEEDPKAKIYISTNTEYGSVYISHNDDYPPYTSTLIARPTSNYVFDKWSDGSIDNPRVIEVTEDIILTAEYTLIKEQNVVYKYNCYVKDQLDMTAAPKAFMTADSFDINEDYMTSATSRINVIDFNENINNGDVIVVYSPKGETLYQGVITSISDDTKSDNQKEEKNKYKYKTINCSQMASFYKGTWIYKTDSKEYLEDELKSLFTEYSEGKLRGSTYIDTLVATRLSGIYIDCVSSTAVNLPTDDEFTEYDMEEFIYKLYQDYGIIFEFEINFSGPNFVTIKVPTYQSISIGNNHFAIQNLSPIQTVEETNRLVIFSSNKVYRTTYVATTNGIVEQPETTANRFNITNTKVVFSDDPVDVLIAGNLPSQMYNHKVTFDLFVENKTYEFNEFHLGMPLEIYYNGTDYYSTVLTGRSINKESNRQISIVSYTCGLVRTSLTKKLSLKK